MSDLCLHCLPMSHKKDARLHGLSFYEKSSRIVYVLSASWLPSHTANVFWTSFVNFYLFSPSATLQNRCTQRVLRNVLFDLILYIPVNNLSVTLGRVFLGWTSTKLGLMCLAQQRSDAGEAWTRGPSVSSQALYHWATTLPLEKCDSAGI